MGALAPPLGAGWIEGSRLMCRGAGFDPLSCPDLAHLHLDVDQAPIPGARRAQWVHHLLREVYVARVSLCQLR
jgi:hypothetical protein